MLGFQTSSIIGVFLYSDYWHVEFRPGNSEQTPQLPRTD